MASVNRSSAASISPARPYDHASSRQRVRAGTGCRGRASRGRARRLRACSPPLDDTAAHAAGHATSRSKRCRRAARRRRSLLGDIRPAFRLRRPAPDRRDQPAEDGDRCVRLISPPVHQPGEPAFDGRGAPALIGRERTTRHQARHAVDIAGGLRVPDRGLRLPVRLAPARRTSEQLRDELRLASLELRPQQLLEEMVVAIPLLVAVQRNHEMVRALERRELCRRVARCEHGVAERTRSCGPGRRSGSGSGARRVGAARGAPSAGSRPGSGRRPGTRPRRPRRSRSPWQTSRPGTGPRSSPPCAP